MSKNDFVQDKQDSPHSRLPRDHKSECMTKINPLHSRTCVSSGPSTCAMLSYYITDVFVFSHADVSRSEQEC